MASEITHTVGTAGAPTRDYSSLTAWDTAQQRDLPTADEIEIAACYNDGEMTDQVDVAGWTTDATRYIKIYTPPGERHTGTENTGFHIKTTTAWQYAIDVQMAYTIVEGLEIENANNFGAIVLGSTTASLPQSGWIDCSHNLVTNHRNGSNDYGILIPNTASGSVQVNIWNNYIFHCGDGIKSADPDVTIVIYNNSISDCADGIDIPATNVVYCKNTACLGCGKDFKNKTYYTAARCKNNASTAAVADSDAAPGADPQHSCVDTDNYVNCARGSEDLDIKDLSADISASGLDLSTDPDGLLNVTDDIHGDARPTWDIGGDFLASGATYTSTFTVDAHIAVRTTSTFDADLHVAERKTSTFTMDLIVLTDATATLGTDGMKRGYTSISTWEALNLDLVTRCERYTVQCFSDRNVNSGIIEDYMDFDGWTTGIDYYVKFEVQPCSRHVGDASTFLPFRIDRVYPGSGQKNVIRLESSSNVWFDGVVFTNSSVTPADRLGLYIGPTQSGYVRITDCIIEADGVGIEIPITAAGAIYIWNTAILPYGTGLSKGIKIDADSSALFIYIYNCSISDCGDGIEIFDDGSHTTDTDLICKNTAVLGSSGLDFGPNAGLFHADCTNNASTDLTAPGANAVTGAVDTDNFESTNSLRVKDIGADIRQQGADLSADATIAFSDDFMGRTRGTTLYPDWDIGCSQFAETTTFTTDLHIATKTDSTFTADLHIATTKVGGTFDVDLHIALRYYSTFTVDTLVAVRLEESLTVDMILQQTRSDTFTVDLLILPPETVKTVGTDGLLRDYTSLTAWEAQELDLPTDGIREVAECYDDTDMRDTCTIAGWTTSNTHYIHIRTPMSQRHYGSAHTGFKMIWDAYAACIKTTVANVWIEGLMFENNLGHAIDVDVAAGSGFIRVSHNIVLRIKYICVLITALPATVLLYIWNNLFSNRPDVLQGAGVTVAISGITAYIYNNSIYQLANGFYVQAGSTLNLHNNVSLNNSTADFFITARMTGAFNISTDALGSGGEAPGTDALYEKEASDNYRDITVGASKDLRIKDADADIYQTGEDLSNDLYLPITDDCYGAPRGGYSRGGAEHLQAEFTADVYVVSVLHWTADLLIAERKTSTFDADLIILDRTVTFTFTADAHIAVRYTSTVTADLHVAERKTSTFTLDFIIGGYSFKADLIIFDPAAYDSVTVDVDTQIFCAEWSAIAYEVKMSTRVPAAYRPLSWAGSAKSMSILPQVAGSRRYVKLGYIDTESVGDEIESPGAETSFNVSLKSTHVEVKTTDGEGSQKNVGFFMPTKYR